MSSKKIKINKQYKDRLFRLLFGSLDMKENIISLYNALNSTDYIEADIEEITTLDDAIYIKMKNDVSFLIDSYLTLWEQQSSYNPNMPIRGFMYFANLFDEYIDKNNYNIYGTKLVKIPTPKYVVFYNGTSDKPAIEKLKLSDAFIKADKDNEFEWTATMYNLNRGKNDKLLSLCKPLSDYMTLIYYIRENQENGYSIKDAVDKAAKRCIEENILSDFLRKHRAEVMDVCITEFNEKVFIDGIHEEGLAEGRAEGRAEGLAEGRAETIRIMLQNGRTPEEIADFGGFEIEKIRKIQTLLKADS